MSQPFSTSRSRVRRGPFVVVLVLLAMVLAGVIPTSMGAGVNAQGAQDVNQPDKIIRTDAAQPGIYHIDYLNDYYKLDPTKYPIDGSIGFWTWSALNPSNGKYDWSTGGAKALENWIKSRVDRSATVNTGVGIMLSTYDATTATDIQSTPDWVIKLDDAVIPATTQSGAEHYIDYYHRTSRKHLNGEFDNGLSEWVASNTTAIVVDATPVADTHTPVNVIDRPASGNAIKLGGLDNLSATLAKESEDTLKIPAMPPSLNGKQNVFVQLRVHMDKVTADPNDHLYVELWNRNGAKLGGTELDINAANFTGADAWQEYRFNVTGFAPENSVRVAFRVVTDGANPTTFWIDNVQLRVRHLIPKYWSASYMNAYKTFITALGVRYKNVPTDAPLNGEAKYGLQFIAMGTGTYGESQPTQDVTDWEYKSTFDHVIKTTPDKGMDTSSEWVAWVNSVTLAYATAFASGDGTGPARHLLLQYAPSFMNSEERGLTTEYAASLGVGISHNRLTPEFTAVYRNDKAGFYDPIRLYWNTVPVAVEAYATDLGCSPVMSYWAVMGGVEKHVDFIRTDPDLLRNSSGNPTGHVPVLDWAGNYLGKTVQNAPKVWTVMREHRNPAVLTCGSFFYVDTGTSSTYPQYGNYNYWLYQIDGITGGKTVAETNDKGADSRYSGYAQAGLGNCPEKSYSNIYIGNPPTCNKTPYNPDLPPLVGQSAGDFYNPSTWTGAGKEAWLVRRTDQATDNPFMFFRVDDGYMKGEGTQSYKAAITVKYFDIGTDKFSIKYDSSTGEKTAGAVTKTGTKQLKTITFTVNDAKFANRLTGSTDFYLDSRNPGDNAKDGNEWLHMVEVEKLDSVLEPTYTPTVTATPTQTETPTITPSPTPNTGSVEGTAYYDMNNNQKLDAGEPGIAGAVLSLSDLLTPDKYTATSGAGGVYRFEGVEPGQYTLKEKTAPPGYDKSSHQIVLLVQANATTTLGTNFPHLAMATATPTATATATETPSATPTATTEPPAKQLIYLPLVVK